MRIEPSPGAADEPIAHAADAPRPGGDLELLQGTWRSIALVIDGRSIPSAALARRRVIIIDDRYVVVDGDRTARRGSFRIDPTTTPRRIDTRPADGPNAGRCNEGIYELDGDLLRVCWSRAGRPRPAELACPTGSGRWMATDQKESPDEAGGPGPVVARAGELAGCPGVSATRVHHREFPEVHGEGGSPYEAALALLRRLLIEEDAIPAGWRRDGLTQAIIDLRAFLDRVA